MALLIKILDMFTLKIKFYGEKTSFKFINILKNKNFLVFVITNQSGIGRGYYSEKDLKNFT